MFNGGWLAYLDERATARRHAEEAYELYRGRRDELDGPGPAPAPVGRAGVRKATKRPKDNDKAQRDFFLNRTEKQAAKVRITEKALDRLEAVDKPWEGWELQLDIAAAPRSGDVVARLEGAVVERGDFRLGPVDLEIGWAERVAILGANGSGKTTLLAALLGDLPLAAGDAVARARASSSASSTRPAIASAGDRAAPAGVRTAVGSREPTTAALRSLLAKFGLGADHVDRPVATLSPGERTRAVLALLMARGVNCLVLDEPTNHLDLPAIEQLEQALDTWEGTLLLVTHDRRLLEAVRVDRTVRGSKAGGRGRLTAMGTATSEIDHRQAGRRRLGHRLATSAGSTPGRRASTRARSTATSARSRCSAWRSSSASSPPTTRPGRFAYSVIGGIPDRAPRRRPIAVSPAGEGSHVTWTVDVEPDSMTELMKNSYDGGLAALKKHHEGRRLNLGVTPAARVREGEGGEDGEVGVGVTVPLERPDLLGRAPAGCCPQQVEGGRCDRGRGIALAREVDVAGNHPESRKAGRAGAPVDEPDHERQGDGRFGPVQLVVADGRTHVDLVVDDVGHEDLTGKGESPDRNCSKRGPCSSHSSSTWANGCRGGRRPGARSSRHRGLRPR